MKEEDGWVFRVMHGCGAKTRNVSVQQNHYRGQTSLQVVVIVSSEPMRQFDIITHLRVTCVNENIETLVTHGAVHRYLNEDPPKLCH